MFFSPQKPGLGLWSAILATSLLSCSAGALAAPVLDLKVLVISTGTAEEDQGLDLIDDMLNETGVPYDVFDASENTLTSDVLATGEQGNYNGIILTDTFLYYTGPDNYLNSALSLEEWQTLHAYERDFEVRESVISGDPVSGDYYKINYDLDYGMDSTTLEASNSFNGVWQNPVGQGELFEYVNTNNALPISDYARAANPSNAANGPVVLPLLTDQDTGKALVSELTYADGRKVLLSTITNAWYLVHSQVLNYEFLNYATQGVFLGSRKIYLEAHIDDLFLADELWNPDTNVTDENNAYRTSAGDITNLVAARNQFSNSYPKLAGLKLDMVFNGGGAAKPAPADSVLTADDDTFLYSRRPTSSYGNRTTTHVRENRRDKRRTLMHFSIPETITNLADTATLKLTTRRTWSSYFWRGAGKICLATEAWDESATWYKRLSSSNWSQAGGSYDNTSCVSYTDNYGSITADIAPLVNKWQSKDKEELGLVLVGTNGNTTQIYSSEHRTASYRPTLTIKYLPEIDALTDAVVEHKDQFRFINHTLSHRDMYKSAGATYDVAKYEIEENLNVWQRLGLPGYNPASMTLVTGNHSGLEDTPSSNVDSPVFVNYPEGHNTELMRATEDLGVKYLASDSSRPNQDVEALVPGTNILLLPRYPTSVFYNVTTPEELEDEYNYIFYERYVNNNQDPCFIPGAICLPRSYQEILNAEADTTLRHMLAFRPWPHYFHASNLRDYGSGATLQYDWLNAVADRYSSVMDLPVIDMPYYEVGVMTEEKLAAKAANVRGEWDRDRNTITVTADNAATVRITGASDGEVYGGQRILKTKVDSSIRVLNVDRALNQ